MSSCTINVSTQNDLHPLSLCNVVKAICDLGLPIAFPPEAKPTIDTLMQQVKNQTESG